MRTNYTRKAPNDTTKTKKNTAGLQPRAKDQLNLQAIRDPVTNEITTDTHTILTTLQSHFEQEHSRTTPDKISTPPCQNPEKADTYTNKCTNLPQKQLPIDEMLTRAHYTMVCQRASSGEAPGPDTLPNEVLKFLPEKAHNFIFSLFPIMAKSSYTPKIGAQAPPSLYNNRKKRPK